MWKRKKGSYTVEAAMLMSILIPVFIGIIYLGFYLHDKALLEGAALETVLLRGFIIRMIRMTRGENYGQGSW